MEVCNASPLVKGSHREIISRYPFEEVRTVYIIIYLVKFSALHMWHSSGLSASAQSWDR